jgi:murein DD-endopeptidase MepM/ murein hydrolase activator NlpD
MKYSFYIFVLFFSLTLELAVVVHSHAQYEKKEENPPPDKNVQLHQPLKNKTGLKKEKYMWPLNINNGFSSSFQEFRSNHFHAGFDLRTYQRTGYPVYAIADGRIYKIRMVKRGSGRGLYLKHDDGNTSVYFHLDQFEENIENVLKRVQQAKGMKYIGNYFLKKPLYYKKGQLIGYSGETGSGFPHLHVEIRDKFYFALNPFPLIQFPVRDKHPPVLRGLLLRNRGNASINGTIGENYFSFKKKGDDLYVLKKPLVITGNFDVVLDTYDLSDSWKRVVPYSISVFIDDKRYFHLEFLYFQRDDNNQLGFVYDMFHSNASFYYFNLFPQKGYLLEQDKLPLTQIIENLDYGKHQLRIVVKDNHDNISTGIVPFYKVMEPEFEMSNVIKTKIKNKNQNKGKNQYQVQMDIDKLVSDPGGEIKIHVFAADGKKISSGKLCYHRLLEKKNFILTDVSRQAAYIDFAFYSHNVLYFKKRLLLTKDHLPSITDVPFDTFINRDEVFIKVKDTNISPQTIGLKVIQGEKSQTLVPQCCSENVYFRFTPGDINPANPVLLHFSIFNANEKIAEIQKKLGLIYLQEGKKQQFKFHEFEAEFDIRSVYEPKVLQIEEKNYDSEFPVLSRQISLSPYHFPFLDTVFYKFKKKLANPKQVGIFKYNFKTGKWNYRYTTYNPVSAIYKHRLISSGVFALMRDIFPPRIWFVKPKTKYKNNLKQIIVKITDKGKGVDDNSLIIWLNGERICPKYECEYDPDRSSAKIEDLTNLQTGRNLLKIQVKDYSGNSASKILTFYLK